MIRYAASLEADAPNQYILIHRENGVNFLNFFGLQDGENGPTKRRGRPPKVKQPEAAETMTEKSRDSRTPTPTPGGEKTEEQKIEKDESKFFCQLTHPVH